MTAVHEIPTLRTERLVLRAHRLDDFDLYAATFAEPRSGYMVDVPSRRNSIVLVARAADILCHPNSNA